MAHYQRNFGNDLTFTLTSFRGWLESDRGEILGSRNQMIFDQLRTKVDLLMVHCRAEEDEEIKYLNIEYYWHLPWKRPSYW